MKSTNYAIIGVPKYKHRSAALTASGMTPERLLLMCSQSNPNSTTESIPYGYCHCGCGELAPVATYTRPEKGWIEGVPHKFRRGHNTRLKSFPRSKLFGAPRPKPRAVPVIDESGEFATIELFSKKYPGRVAKIDVDDIPLVSEYRWQPNSGGYAQAHVAGKRGDNTRRTILMHRLLMGHPTSKHVDHINGDKLDNRRSNLRVVTAAQNSWNKKKKSGTTSRFIGVCAAKTRWSARLRCNGVVYAMHGFKCEIEAAIFRDVMSIELRDDVAPLNFPELREVFS